MDNEIVNHLIDIKTNLASQDVRLEKIETAVLGNGQPGLAQKVESLEAHKNWLWGAGATISTLLGWIGWEHIIKHK